MMKVVLLGDTAVGKTCIARRFVDNTFDNQEKSSSHATFVTKSFTIAKPPKTIRFQIWDTAGQERYRSMATMYYQNAEAAILVYDLTNPESFEGLKIWVKELQERGPRNLLKVIVGNKLDIADNPAVDSNKVEEYVKELNAISLIVSAKLDVNINKIFEQIALRSCGIHEAKKGSYRKRLSSTVKSNTSNKCC